jgi:hypothetical protein
MRYIKTYEENNSNNIPEVGDYVLLDVSYDSHYTDSFEELGTFINNSIGKVKHIDDTMYIEYYYIPKNIKKYFYNHDLLNLKNVRAFYIRDVTFCSKNKKDCEIYLSTNKYNL